MSTDLFVLVGSNSDELGLFEDEGTKSAVGNLEDVVCSNQMEARLIFMHGVQDRLQQSIQFKVRRMHVT